MSRVWLTTDTHLWHKNIVEFAGRPPDHTERILANLERLVKVGDTLIHLGDITIGEDLASSLAIRAKIPQATRVLVRGNHDTKSDAWYRDKGWHVVVETLTVRAHGHRVLLSHMPQAGDHFTLNIHGHFHNILPHRWEGELVRVLDDRHLLLALEYTAYQPVLLETLIKAAPKMEGVYRPYATKSTPTTHSGSPAPEREPDGGPARDRTDP